MPKGSNAAYRPGVKDYRYVAGLREVLREPGPAPRTRLAQLTGITRNKLATFERHPGRMAWVRAQLAAERDDEWERIVTVAYHKALRGDVKWALFYAQAIGKFGPALERGSGEAIRAPEIIMTHIPRPELPPVASVLSPMGTIPVPGVMNNDVLNLSRQPSGAYALRREATTIPLVNEDILDLTGRPTGGPAPGGPRDSTGRPFHSGRRTPGG